MNKITIKFGTELKSAKHIVVNYNFTEWSLSKKKKKILWNGHCLQNKFAAQMNSKSFSQLYSMEAVFLEPKENYTSEIK